MFTGSYNGREHLKSDFDWLPWRGLKGAADDEDDSLLRPAVGRSVVTVFYPYNQHLLMDTGICITTRQQKHVIPKVCLQVFKLPFWRKTYIFKTHWTVVYKWKDWGSRILYCTLELLEYSADGAVIMPSMSPPSSGTLSLIGELESRSRLPPVPLLSRPSPSDWRTSLAALRFLSERSLPMGPGLYSLCSRGGMSGNCRGEIDF